MAAEDAIARLPEGPGVPEGAKGVEEVERASSGFAEPPSGAWDRREGIDSGASTLDLLP